MPLRLPRLAVAQQNNLSTMRAKKRTRYATSGHRHFCRCLRGVVPAFAPRRACDHRGGDRRRCAVWPQAVEKDGEAKRGAEARPEKRTARSRGSRTWAVLMPEGAPSYTPPRHCLDDAEPRLTDRCWVWGGRRGERSLFQRRRDGRERRIEVGAERRDHGDDGDRDACCQQAVFDGGRPLLIGKEVPEQCAHDLVLSLKFSRPSCKKSCSSARVRRARVNLGLRLNGTVTRFAKILRNKNLKIGAKAECRRRQCAAAARERPFSASSSG